MANMENVQPAQFRQPLLIGIANWFLGPFSLSLFWSSAYEITDAGNGMALGTPVGPRRLAVMRHVKFEEGGTIDGH